ncbi:stage II sporulation protein R [Caproicibacterium sp. NSD3]
MRLFTKAVAAALVLCLAISCTGITAAGEGISDRVLRLHVLANSDSEEDQALKLKVRDRVLSVSEQWFKNVDSREEAQEAAAAHLADLKEAGEEVLRENGSNDPVEVRLEDCWFPTRTYGNVTLPAGTYRALRILIGEGKGHNWWCVLFPALCLPGAEQDSNTLSDVLTPAQEEMTQPGFAVKFKTVELYEEIRQWLSQNS